MSVNVFDQKTGQLIQIAGNSTTPPEIYIGDEEPKDKVPIWINPSGKAKGTTAEGVSYDNSGSGLSAENVQEALDFLSGNKVTFYRLTSNNIDNPPIEQLYRIGFGLFDNRAYFSIDISWIKIQFSVRANSTLHYRVKYGENPWTEWTAVSS